MKKSLKAALIKELANSIISIINLDAPDEKKRAALNHIFSECTKALEQKEINEAFDIVCNHFGDSKILANLLSDTQQLREEAVYMNAEAVNALEGIAQLAHENSVPIFMHTHTVRPIAILSLPIFNALVSGIDQRLVVNENDIIAKTATPVDVPTEREQ